MSSIRIRGTAERDGELHLRGLPLHKGEETDVIVLTEGGSDDEILAVLKHDPAWAWLRDPAEDVYTEDDAVARGMQG